MILLNWFINHEKLFSESTTQNAKENIYSFACGVQVVNNAPPYLFFIIVPSTDITGQQYFQPKIHATNVMKKYKNFPCLSTLFSTIKPTTFNLKNKQCQLKTSHSLYMHYKPIILITGTVYREYT